MDIIGALTAFGVIVSGLAGFSGLIIALMERRKKQVDIAEKMTQIAYSLLPPLRQEIAELQKEITALQQEVDGHQLKIAAQKQRITELEISSVAQLRTIEGLQQMLAEKDTQLCERDKLIIHMQSQINKLTAKIAILEKRGTGELLK